MHARDTLIALLWPEADQEQGRHGLRNVLHAIRKAIGSESLVGGGDGLVGIANGAVRCDALDAEAHLERHEWDRALALYQGELLAGFHVSEAHGFEEWLTDERFRLHRLMVQAATSQADARSAAGDLPGATRAAEQRTRLAPLEEAGYRQLITLLLEQGEQARARRVYDRLAQRMQAEFGAAPSPRTEALLPITSVAVLPWSVGGDVPDGEELAEGLTAALTSVLARVPGLHVPALGVVRRLGSLDTDAQAAGAALGVASVVIGRLSDAGNACRLRAELIRVADGRLLLGDARNTRRERLHSVPHDLAIAICHALGMKPGDSLQDVVPAVSAGAGDAWVHYVRGQYHFLRAAANGDPADLEQAREFFERALERDPACAPAYAGLANFHAVAAARGVRTPFEQEFGRAIELSREAIALDPTLGMPHVHFGVRAMYLDGDLERAGREFRTAVEVEPTCAEGHRFLAIWHGLHGEGDEALQHFQQAAAHEPDMPSYRNGLADALMRAGRYQEAGAELRRALAVDPCYGAARERLLRCLEALGSWDEAVAVRREAGNANAEQFAAALAQDGEEGYRAERKRELQVVIQRLTVRANSPALASAPDRFNPVELQLALAHAELGEWEAVRAWRDRLCSVQPWRDRWFSSHPSLKGR